MRYARIPGSLHSRGPAIGFDRPGMVPVYVTALLCAVPAIVVSLVQGAPAFPLDDAYIVLHNAQVLFTADNNFVGVPALAGATSLLHTLAVGILSLFLPGELALWLLSWLAVFATASAFEWLTRSFGMDWRYRLAVTLCVLTAGRPLLIFLNGVETGWAIAGASWALALAAAPRRGRALPVLCGLLPFVRPELAALAGLLMADRLWQRRSAAAGLRSAAAPMAADAAFCAAPFLVLAIVQYVLGGALIPETATAKHYFFAEGDLPWFVNPMAVAIAFGKFAVVVGPIAVSLVFMRSRIAQLGIGFAAAVLGAFMIWFPVGAAHNDFRYLYILLPIIGVNLVYALHSADRTWRMLALGLLLCGLAYNVVTLAQSAGPSLARAKGKVASMAKLAGWVRTHLDPSKPLLVHDSGYVAYATSQHMVDLVGLKNPRSIAYHKRFTARTGNVGRANAIAHIARATGACYIAVSSGWEPVFQMAAGLKARGWTLTRLTTGDEAGPYTVYALTDPGPDAALPGPPHRRACGAKP